LDSELPHAEHGISAAFLHDRYRSLGGSNDSLAQGDLQCLHSVPPHSDFLLTASVLEEGQEVIHWGVWEETIKSGLG